MLCYIFKVLSGDPCTHLTVIDQISTFGMNKATILRTKGVPIVRIPLKEQITFVDRSMENVSKPSATKRALTRTVEWKVIECTWEMVALKRRRITLKTHIAQRIQQNMKTRNARSRFAKTPRSARLEIKDFTTLFVRLVCEIVELLTVKILCFIFE